MIKNNKEFEKFAKDDGYWLNINANNESIRLIVNINRTIDKTY